VHEITVSKTEEGWVVSEGANILDACDSNKLSLVLCEICELYTTSEVKCEKCGHVWVAIHPFSTLLECPNCYNVVGVNS